MADLGIMLLWLGYLLHANTDRHRSDANWCSHDDVSKLKQFPRCWPFVQGIQRSPEAGDLRRHRAHYDVTVMVLACCSTPTMLQPELNSDGTVLIWSAHCTDFLLHINFNRISHSFNTLMSRQDSHHFGDVIFLNENVRMSIKISVEFVFKKGPMNDLPTLVQIMTWRRPGDKPLSEPMMVSLSTHICVTRPQRV